MERTGRRGPARAAYQEAVVRGEQCGDRQVLAAALTGLALARGAAEPRAAARLARRAAGQCPGRTRIRALVAAGWVAEARAVHAELLARLATAAAERGDHHAEVHFRLRLLARDPYDEETHLALIALLAAAGRHGEARRRHLLYMERMEEIDVEPSPFPRPDRRARSLARPAHRERDRCGRTPAGGRWAAAGTGRR